MCKLPGLSKLKNQTMKFDAVYLNEQLCLAETLMNVPIGGEGGIRTHGRLAPTPDFESGTFDHSATSPE